jgi:hypothetical protein
MHPSCRDQTHAATNLTLRGGNAPDLHYPRGPCKTCQNSDIHPPRHRVEIPLVIVYVYCTGAFECSDDKTFLYDN